MEFYSERCQDWLDKSDRIHPDKLAMEVERFNKMLQACGSDEVEAKEDLALTVQLLQERLDEIRAAEQLESENQATQPQDVEWDLGSLTDPQNVDVETLDTKTKEARKQALLNHPSIGLGAAGIKRRP